MSFTAADGAQLREQVSTLMQQMTALMDQNAAITAASDSSARVGNAREQEANSRRRARTAADGREGTQSSGPRCQKYVKHM